MTFKIHPLHTAKRHADVMRDLGVYGYHEWLEDKRCTGRSSALILRCIAEAIEKPFTAIPILDHSHESSDGSCAKRNFAEAVLSTVNQLGLHSMHTQLRNGTYYLTFGEVK